MSCKNRVAGTFLNPSRSSVPATRICHRHGVPRTPYTAGVSPASKTVRAWLDAILSWASLGYGIYTAAITSVTEDDDVQIAVGVAAILVALATFLWAGNPRSLGGALILVGLAAPVIGYSTATLFWYDVQPFVSEAFWTNMIGGAVVGVPLIALGAYILLRSRPPATHPDPWWYTPLRWALQGGLMVIVLAFQAGDWDAGIPLVYAGGALALLALVIALPRRVAVTRRGIGRLLLFLGLCAAAVIGVASASGGGNVSGDEAAVGLVPAAVVAIVGLLLAMSSRDAGRASSTKPATTAAPAEISTDGLDGSAIDTLGDTRLP